MKRPSLQLDYYCFPVIFIKATDAFDFSDDDNNSNAYIIETDSSIASQEEDKTKFKVRLNITVKSSEGHNAPYAIELQVIGFFTLEGELANDKQRALQIVYSNGSSILYGAAREFILLTTSRGPWPHCLLPTTNFPIAEFQKIENPEEAEKKLVPKKRKKPVNE